MSYDKRIPQGKQLSSLKEKDWLQKNPLEKTQKTFFPRSISLEDIDKSVYKWFTENDIKIGEVQVTTTMLTTEKWAEFYKRWKNMDNDKNMIFPYVTIRRSMAPTLAQDQVKGRIPGMKYTTYRVPHYSPTGPTYKIYKVPSPIKIDLEYEVRMLSHYIEDANTMSEIMLRHFASLQAYLNIEGHFMPMTIDSISDETESTDIEDERVIHTVYLIKVKGYIIDETEFEEKIGVSGVEIHLEENVT